MKRFITAVAILLAAATSHAQVSVTIGGQVAPGVYGEINIGDARPQVYYSQPLVVQRPRIVRPPIYVYVPHEQRRDWRNSCATYRACDREVYFVEEGWYREHQPRHFNNKDRFENGHDNRDNDNRYNKRNKHNKHNKHRH